MAIVRGILFGFGLCLFALFLFVMIGGAAGFYATRQAQSDIEEQIDAGLEDAPPAMREMARRNARELTRAGLYGEEPSAEESGERRERSRAFEHRMDERRRRREQQRDGISVSHRSGQPMQRARPMVEVSN